MLYYSRNRKRVHITLSHRSKKFLEIFQKPIDKCAQLWYNMYVIKGTDYKKFLSEVFVSMVAIKFFNENGNVSVKVRDGIRPQILEKALAAMSAEFEGAVKNANGGISVPVAVDEGSGETVYAHFDMTVNTKSPDIKTERKKSAKKAAAVEEVTPNLFD